MADGRNFAHGRSGMNQQPYQLTTSHAPSSNAATAGSVTHGAPPVQRLTPGYFVGESAASFRRVVPVGARAPPNEQPYNDPELVQLSQGQGPSNDQYGPLSRLTSVVRGPPYVQQVCSPDANQPVAGPTAPGAHHRHVIPWPQGNGNRPLPGTNNAMDAFLNDWNDPYGYPNGPRRGFQY